MTNDTDILSQPYRAQAFTRLIPTLAEEKEMVEKARQGDEDAREAIITSCLGYVMAIARSLSLSRDIEYDELVGMGNLILVEKLDMTLTKDNPIAYLKVCVKWGCSVSAIDGTIPTN